METHIHTELHEGPVLFNELLTETQTHKLQEQSCLCLTTPHYIKSIPLFQEARIKEHNIFRGTFCFHLQYRQVAEKQSAGFQKCWYVSNKSHNVSSQRRATFITTILIISDLGKLLCTRMSRLFATSASWLQDFEIKYWKQDDPVWQRFAAVSSFLPGQCVDRTLKHREKALFLIHCPYSSIHSVI